MHILEKVENLIFFIASTFEKISANTAECMSGNNILIQRTDINKIS